MRKLFAKKLYNYMEKNDKIYFLTGDLGYQLFNRIQNKFYRRFINCGASEQAMLDIAVGLATSGKIPFVYSITPFILYRPYETIRNSLNYEKIPVKLIGVGRNKEYGKLGFSHWAEDDSQVMKNFPNIESYWPEYKDFNRLFDKIIYNNKPVYINLKKHDY